MIAEGMTQAEVVWNEKVGGDNKDWRALKAQLPEALAKDLAAHLEEAWPLAVEEDPSQTAKDLKGFYAALSTPGVLLNAYAQTKWSEATGARVRIPGTFVLGLAFGEEALHVTSILRRLDKQLRKKSGLKVDGEEPMPQAGLVVKRVLLYPEKTAEERSKGKGNDGKGHKGKAKGKGQAKAGAAAGAEVAAEAAGADGAAAPAAPAEGKGKGKGKGKKGKGKAKGQKGAAAAGQ